MGVGSDHLSQYRSPDQAHSLLFIIPFPASRRRQVPVHEAVAMLVWGKRLVSLFTDGRPEECHPIGCSASSASTLRYPETAPVPHVEPAAGKGERESQAAERAP